MNSDAKETAPRDFPPDFVWGAASCPAACEGETVSDWGGMTAGDGSVADDGPRHWRRYRFDFRAMADMGVRAYRFGCDWGRLQREPYAPLGRDDLLRYLEMLAELRSLGIEPWLTLFQHALPRWASAAGGWLNPETPHWFGDFASRLTDATDGEVRHWVTFHEPQVYALSRHAWGVFPGGGWGRMDQVRAALKGMHKGHRLAVAALRRRLPEARIGLTLSGGGFSPRHAWNPAHWLAVWTAEWFFNRAGLEGFLGGDACDFLMLGAGNELTVGVFDALSLGSCVSPKLSLRMRSAPATPPERRRRKRIADWRGKCRLPVYLVGSPGPGRPEGELCDLLRACADVAGQNGAAGFFYAPLLDEFDPALGLKNGRGLLRVDFHAENRRREPQGRAKLYGRVIKSGRLPPQEEIR